MSARVARRYAKALFALARDARALDAVGAELGELRNGFTDPAVVEVLASPTMTATRLKTVVKNLATQMRLSELVANFLGVLAENHRIDQLPAAVDHFEALHDRALNRIRVSIRSAAPLAVARQRDLIAKFERLSGKTVLATIAVDPRMLGGVMVEAEGKVFDGSLRTQLEHLAHEITSTRTYL